MGEVGIKSRFSTSRIKKIIKTYTKVEEFVNKYGIGYLDTIGDLSTHKPLSGGLNVG